MRESITVVKKHPQKTCLLFKYQYAHKSGTNRSNSNPYARGTFFTLSLKRIGASGGRTVELKMDDINYIQSYENYVKVFTTHKIHLVLTTTQEILSNLYTRKFTYIHKSYIGNISKITKHTESEVIIHNEKLPIGITFKREVLECLVRSD